MKWIDITNGYGLFGREYVTPYLDKRLSVDMNTGLYQLLEVSEVSHSYKTALSGYIWDLKDCPLSDKQLKEIKLKRLK